MSEQNLTAPEMAKIRRRVKLEEVADILLAPTATTSSVAVVESPKRRKVESAAESASYNRSSLSYSPRKPLWYEEKHDSPEADTRQRRFGSRNGLHAPSSTDCSEEESSSYFFEKIADPSDDWLKNDTSSHIDGNSVVVSSPESEVCVDLAEKEMESNSTANNQSRSVVFETPTAAEIEKFFLAAEKTEAQRFKDKYNFDIVNDVPVKGRFEWSPVKY